MEWDSDFEVFPCSRSRIFSGRDDPRSKFNKNSNTSNQYSSINYITKTTSVMIWELPFN